MCSKHVEAWNKLIIKFSASRWLILINKYIEMHCQQNIKKKEAFWSPCNIICISSSVIGIIFKLGNFPGNDSLRNEIAFPFSWKKRYFVAWCRITYTLHETYSSSRFHIKRNEFPSTSINSPLHCHTTLLPFYSHALFTSHFPILNNFPFFWFLHPFHSHPTSSSLTLFFERFVSQ